MGFEWPVCQYMCSLFCFLYLRPPEVLSLVAVRRGVPVATHQDFSEPKLPRRSLQEEHTVGAESIKSCGFSTLDGNSSACGGLPHKHLSGLLLYCPIVTAMLLPQRRPIPPLQSLLHPPQELSILFNHNNKFHVFSSHIN